MALVMEPATRQVTCAVIAPHPDGTWMQQIGQNLMDIAAGFLPGKRFPVVDQDALYAQGFTRLIQQAGIQPVSIPPSAPNCNAHIERFNGSFEREAADRVIFFGESYLRRVVDEYLDHYHRERNHQGHDHQIVASGGDIGRPDGKIRRRERLGGMFYCYYREAA